jgi:hypothetical protein
MKCALNMSECCVVTSLETISQAAEGIDPFCKGDPSNHSALLCCVPNIVCGALAGCRMPLQA